jgi:hypothetical protein
VWLNNDDGELGCINPSFESAIGTRCSVVESLSRSRDAENE